jgi:hypothetical protein
MSEEIAFSRRKVLSVLGLAAALGLVGPTVLAVSDAEAQTSEKKESEKEGGATGTERRHERREGREKRRHERREGREKRRHERREDREKRHHERREDRKEGGTEPKGETKSKQ